MWISRLKHTAGMAFRIVEGDHEVWPKEKENEVTDWICTSTL